MIKLDDRIEAGAMNHYAMVGQAAEIEIVNHQGDDDCDCFIPKMKCDVNMGHRQVKLPGLSIPVDDDPGSDEEQGKVLPGIGAYDHHH